MSSSTSLDETFAGSQTTKADPVDVEDELQSLVEASIRRSHMAGGLTTIVESQEEKSETEDRVGFEKVTPIPDLATLAFQPRKFSETVLQEWEGYVFELD